MNDIRQKSYTNYIYLIIYLYNINHIPWCKTLLAFWKWYMDLTSKNYRPLRPLIFHWINGLVSEKSMTPAIISILWWWPICLRNKCLDASRLARDQYTARHYHYPPLKSKNFAIGRNSGWISESLNLSWHEKTDWLKNTNAKRQHKICELDQWIKQG